MKISDVQKSGASLTVIWNSVSYRHYAIVTSDSLSTPNWTVLPGADDLVGQHGQSQFVIPLVTGQGKFIRIRVLTH